MCVGQTQNKLPKPVFAIMKERVTRSGAAVTLRVVELRGRNKRWMHALFAVHVCAVDEASCATMAMKKESIILSPSSIIYLNR